MKKRNLLLVFISFLSSACAVVPQIHDLNLNHPVMQDQFTRTMSLVAHLSDDASTVTLGQRNGQVVLGHIETVGACYDGNYSEQVISHRFPFSIKAITQDLSENHILVRDSQLRGLGDRIIEQSQYPVDSDHRGCVYLFDGNDGSVIWGGGVKFYVSAFACFDKNVVFAGPENLFIRDVTNESDTRYIDIHQYGRINNIDFYDKDYEASIFCVFDHNLLLYDIATGAELFNLSLESLGLRRARHFSNAIFKKDLLFTVTDGFVRVFKCREDTCLFDEINVLHKNVPSELKLRLYENKNVLLGYGYRQLLVNQDNYSHDVVYVWPNVPETDCITLNFDKRIFVIDVAVTNHNEIVAIVAVDNTLRMVTITFKNQVSSFVKRIESFEIGERHLHGGKILPHGERSFNIEFDETLNTFFIAESEMPASSDFDDSDDDDCPPRRRPIPREWGQGTVGEDGSELYEDY